MDPEIQAELDYLDEVLDDYQRYVLNIGVNRHAAPLLLYYRSEVQESLDALQQDQVDLKDRWRRVAELDNIVREKSSIVVREVGYHNFRQYQVINDPPRSHWWWYMDLTAPKPEGERRPWEFWRR